jgi:hypothetical protein
MTIDFREVSFQLSWMNMNESFHHQPPLRDGWMKTFNLVLLTESYGYVMTIGHDRFEIFQR